MSRGHTLRPRCPDVKVQDWVELVGAPNLPAGSTFWKASCWGCDFEENYTLKREAVAAVRHHEKSMQAEERKLRRFKEYRLKENSMTDPRFIPPSDREYDRQHVLAGARPTVADYLDLSDHATFMDERDARQRDLIRRLADALNDVVQVSITYTGPGGMENCARLVVEARGIEATNE